MASILIVEDEKSISDMIMMNLKLVGHTGRQAFNGREAITAMEEDHPDLVLLDVMLPFVDGFSLLEQKAFADTPLILLTASNTTADKVKGLKLGADDYITKPFETVELLARIEAILSKLVNNYKTVTSRLI